jgi:D-sedoheptulose 7-phosphate isomerase
MNKSFFNNYLKNISKLILEQNQHKDKLLEIAKTLKKLKKNKNKLLIFGNGGSASISSHASIDFSNNHSLKTMNFSDTSLITCFSNDYGYEKWMSKAINIYGQEKDVLLVVSSSGESKNIINACKEAKKKKFDKIITFTGFKKNNSTNKIGDINIWVNSQSYNFVENTHQILILSIVDFLKK